QVVRGPGVDGRHAPPVANDTNWGGESGEDDGSRHLRDRRWGGHRRGFLARAENTAGAESDECQPGRDPDAGSARNVHVPRVLPWRLLPVSKRIGQRLSENETDEPFGAD